MNTNLVNILTWAKPVKSTAALLSVNIILWFLIRQRPLCVIPLAVLVYYLRYIWKHRIRPEVMVDPPDHEDWITLSSYDLEHVTCNLGNSLWKSWVNLRHENHVLWTVGTSTVFGVLAKIGSEMDFLTFLFVVSNAAFVICPLLEFLPKGSLADSTTIIKTEDLIPEEPKASAADLSPRKRAASFSSHDFSPVAVPLTNELPSSSQSLYEGILARSMTAAAVTAIVSSSISSKVFSSGIIPSQLLNPLVHMDASLSFSRDSSPGPESLTPAVNSMPDHEVVDSDLEDEFLFDAKHFDKSSSSSISNSFEIIDDL